MFRVQRQSRYNADSAATVPVMTYPLLPYPNLHPICPVDALPDLLREVVHFAILKKDIPPAIALTDAIAAAAAVVHCGYDCVTPDGDTMPATINTTLSAPSTAGKGRSYRLFFRPLVQAMKRAIAGDASPVSIKAGARLPPVPRVETMLSDPSYCALLHALHGTGMNVAIQREDSASLLETDLFRKRLDTLTQVWSGDPPLDHVVLGKQLRVKDGRCCVGIRIQQYILDDISRRRGPLAYKLGFWPRSIAGCHEPDRFPANETYQVRQNWDPSADGFEARMLCLALLINSAHQGGFTGRIPVELDSEAKAYMLELGFRIKQWRKPYYQDIREAAGRAWENTLRVAVVLHVFCVGEGKVSRDLVGRAWAIVEWSLSQHRLIFIESPRMHEVPAITAPMSMAQPICVTQPKRQKLPRPLQEAEWFVFCLAKLVSPCRSVTVREVNQLAGLSQKRLQVVLAWIELEGLVRLAPKGPDTLIIPLVSSHPLSQIGH